MEAASRWADQEQQRAVGSREGSEGKTDPYTVLGPTGYSSLSSVCREIIMPCAGEQTSVRHKPRVTISKENDH
jgi:hypothetical protein